MKKNHLILIIACLILASAMLATTACSSGSKSTTTTAPNTTSTTAPNTSTIAPSTTSTAPPSTTTTTSAPPSTVAPKSTTPASSSATPKYGGTLKFGTDLFPGGNLGWNGDPGGIDGIGWTCLFYDTLVDVDAQGGLHSSLLTDWQSASDLKSMKLTLQKGIKFSDGSDWNATVAKWNMDLLIGAKYSYWANISSVDILDDYNVRLNISKWSNSILAMMGESHMTSKAAYDAHGANKDAEKWMYANPIGTGPFIMTSYTPNGTIKGKRNDNYWRGKPYLDSVEFINFTDPMTKVNAFQAGELDVMDGDLGKAEYDLKQKGAIVYPTFLAVMSLEPDSKNPQSPLSNLKVRQAIDYAINREELVKNLGYGWWAPTYQWALPTMSCYINDLQGRTYNPDKAKQLLAEAGYPNIHTQILGSTAISPKDVLVAVQGYLSKVGITAEVKMVDNGTFWNMNTKGYDGFLGIGLAISPADPDTNYYQFMSQSSPFFASLQKTPELQALLDAASATAKYDPAASKKIVQYVFDNAMVNPIYGIARGALTQPYVHDLNYGNYISVLYFDPAKTWLSK
jgi:peptide/nickel transport system substrate-binding protein